MDELNAQQRRENKSRNSLTPSHKKREWYLLLWQSDTDDKHLERSRSMIEKSSGTKEVVDFDEWEAVPLDSDRYYGERCKCRVGLTCSEALLRFKTCG